GGVFEIGVDVGGAHVMPACSVLPRQELLGLLPSAECPQDAQHVGISDLPDMPLPALPDVVELGSVSANDDVLASEGGQAVGAVVRVVLAADPEESSVQEPNRAGEHALARVPAPSQVHVDPGAQRRQRFGEGLDPFELLAIPLVAPLRVVEVLTPSSVVGSGRLQMTPIVGADPYLG